jgi:hypothetical protein
MTTNYLIILLNQLILSSSQPLLHLVESAFSASSTDRVEPNIISLLGLIFRHCTVPAFG